MNEGEVQAFVDEIALRAPTLHELATCASLAVRITPPLLRRLRQRLMPQAEPGLEADLWFSPLVENHDRDACLLHPAIARLLRQSLARSGRLDAVWAIVDEAHADAPPSQRVEERIAYLALREDDAGTEIADELRRALKAMLSSPERGVQVARWALQALPRLPDRVAAGPEARALEQGMHARIAVVGASTHWRETPVFELERDGWVLPPNAETPRVAIGLRLDGAVLQVVEPHDERAFAELPIPDSRTRRLQLRISVGSDATPRYAALRGRPGEQAVFDVTPLDIEVTTEAGEVYGLDAVAEAAPAAAEVAIRHAAFISYSRRDGSEVAGWVDSFRDELDAAIQLRLPQARLPVFRDDSNIAVGERWDDAIVTALTSSFSLVILVGEGYVDSEFCRRELDLFIERGPGDAVRERIYVVVMSEPAMRRLQDEPWWRQRLPEVVWLPFFDRAAPHRPLDLRRDRDRMERLVDDLTGKLRRGLPEPHAETPDAAVDIFIESTRDEPDRWLAIGDALSHRWGRLLDRQAVEPRPMLRPHAFTIDPRRRLPEADGADAVVLLWTHDDAKSVLSRAMQVEKMLDDPIPAFIAHLSPPQAPASAPLEPLIWPVLRFRTTPSGGTEIVDDDIDALDRFLEKILDAHLFWRHKAAPA